MKKSPLVILTVIALNAAMGQVSVTVMSFNIRYNNPKDSANAWPNRKDLVASQVLFHDAQLVGVQEALPGQMTDLLERLTRFQFVGVGRDDGKEKGEYSALQDAGYRIQGAG